MREQLHNGMVAVVCELGEGAAAMAMVLGSARARRRRERGRVRRVRRAVESRGFVTRIGLTGGAGPAYDHHTVRVAYAGQPRCARAAPVQTPLNPTDSVTS